MNGREWLPKHQAILEQLGGRIPDDMIAAKTGHDRSVIVRRRRAANIPPYCTGTARYGTWNDLPLPSKEAIQRALAKKT